MRLRGRHGGVLPRACITLGRLGCSNGLLRRAADGFLGRPLAGLVLRGVAVRGCRLRNPRRLRRVAARDAFGRALGLYRLLQALLAHLQQFGLRPVEVFLRRRGHGAAHIGERALKLSDGPAQVGGRWGRHARAQFARFGLDQAG